MFQFEWNNAGQFDWPKIKRLFVAAYVGVYKHCDPKELDLNANVVAHAKAHNHDPLVAYFEHCFDDEFTKIIDQSKNDKFRINYLVVRMYEQPVAFIVSQLNYKSGRVYIRWNTVAPIMQNQGLGKRMLSEVARYYDNNGLELYTRSTNTKACDFYRKCGLKEVSQYSFAEPKAGEAITPYAKMWLQNEHYQQTLYAPEDERVTKLEAYTAFCRKQLHL